MADREQSINLAISLVQQTCESFDILIFPKERNGKYYSAVKDTTTGKEYFITKEK